MSILDAMMQVYFVLFGLIVVLGSIILLQLLSERLRKQQPPTAAQPVTPPRALWYRVAEAIAKWIGNRIADMGGSRTPGGKK